MRDFKFKRTGSGLQVQYEYTCTICGKLGWSKQMTYTIDGMAHRKCVNKQKKCVSEENKEK
jgi:hypothetical protein